MSFEGGHDLGCEIRRERNPYGDRGPLVPLVKLDAVLGLHAGAHGAVHQIRRPREDVRGQVHLVALNDARYQSAKRGGHIQIFESSDITSHFLLCV